MSPVTGTKAMCFIKQFFSKVKILTTHQVFTSQITASIFEAVRHCFALEKEISLTGYLWFLKLAISTALSTSKTLKQPSRSAAIACVSARGTNFKAVQEFKCESRQYFCTLKFRIRMSPVKVAAAR